MAELLTRIDIWIIVIYLAGMLGVAFWVSSGSRDVEGYTVGNRSLPGWLIGISVLGTFLSSITFLGLPAKIIKDGDWNGFVFGLALPLAALIATLFFVPLYRNKLRLSAFGLLEDRFGVWARLYADASYLVLQLLRIGIVLLLVAFAVEPMLSSATAEELRATLTAGGEGNVDRMVGILLTLGVLVIVYDTLGGIRAVIWTDVLQVGILLFGAAWCLCTIIFAWDGGASGFFRAVEPGSFSLGPTSQINPDTGDWDFTVSTVWVLLIYGLTENLRNYGADQNYVQRMLAAESDREASKSIWIGALSYVPVSMIFCLIGTGLAMEMGQGSESVIPPDLASDQVFPYFIRYALPAPIAGLVIAAILAAAMSTVDSSLNSCSTVLLADVYRPLAKRFGWKLPEIAVVRGFTVLFGAVGTGMAVLLLTNLGQDGSKVLMDHWWKYAGMAGSGLFGLFLLAWLMPRIPSMAAALAVVAGLAVVIWGNLTEAQAQQVGIPWLALHGNLVGVAGTAVILLIGAAALAAVNLGALRENERHRQP